MQHTGSSSRWSLCKHGRCQRARDIIIFRSHVGSNHFCTPGIPLVTILFLLLPALVMRGGIKQRLRVDEAETTVRGGLRQRFCSASSSSTAPRAKTAPHYAKRRKLETEPEDVSNLPLNTSLRRDWARGILPSNKVLEYAAGAASQGARGIPMHIAGLLLLLAIQRMPRVFRGLKYL